ncbi:hypothetical protein [Streptomyces sp. NPDC001530]|uniref:hypothetical protein n=1 Tax=Streptomyces sp. NPDC001530 TaxID=3364582 RepID=UPI0036A68F97
MTITNEDHGHAPGPPPVTLITVDDDATIFRAAQARSDPLAGHVTVGITPHTPRTTAHLARDILRALGRTDYQPTASAAITAASAWRAAACWITVMDIHQIVVLRAHLLTEARTRRLAELRARTGIHLVLITPTGTPATSARLHTLLGRHRLDHRLQQITRTHTALDFLGPPAPHRPTPTEDVPTPLPHVPLTRLRAEQRHRRPRKDSACADAQYRAGVYAATTWLRRNPGPPPQQDLEFFLSRLTTTSPSLRHTLARLRGAQTALLYHGLLLDLPSDLEATTGPGITTCPFTHTWLTASAGAWPTPCASPR